MSTKAFFRDGCPLSGTAPQIYLFHAFCGALTVIGLSISSQ
jgi:hypothetical protein